MDFKDYYEVLGVERDDSQEAIKSAYRKLARQYHPDVSREPDAEERFKEIGEAYEVLKDPEKRAAYDQLGADWQNGQEFRPPPDWQGDFEFGGGGFTGQEGAAYSDFFESLFGGRGAGPAGRAGPRQSGFKIPGEDLSSRVWIDLEDAYQGATRQLSLRRPEVSANGRVQQKTRTLNVKIPRGVRPGQQIRLAGQGGQGFGGGPPGDLYLEILFNDHPRYRVEGADVYLELPVAPWEAALGAKVKVPTPGGAVDLSIPQNSKAGARLRLRGRGLPGKPAGDLFVVLKVALPPADSETAKALYRQMREALSSSFDPRAELRQ